MRLRALPSKIDWQTRTGRLLRTPLRLVPKRAELPVLSGPLRGKRWIVGSGPHSYWMGIYEAETQRLLLDLLEPGAAFYDVGAQSGYFSLLAADLVGPDGKVFAFEPFPDNAKWIRRHFALNSASNAELVEAAVYDREGMLSFRPGTTTGGGKLADTGDLTVRAVTIDSFTLMHPPPDVMKVDVEGAEAALLRGAEKTIRQRRPSILLSTHGAALEQECINILDGFGYRTDFIGESTREWLCQPT